MSDVRDELTDIQGVGEATADKIEAVYEGAGIGDTVAKNVRQAYDYYEDGQYSYAGKFLDRAYQALED